MATFSPSQSKLLARLQSLETETRKTWSLWQRRGREIAHNTNDAIQFVLTSLAEESRHISLNLYGELEPKLRKNFPQFSWPESQQMRLDLGLDPSLAPLTVTHDSVRRNASLLRDPFQND
jgi:hypothetical protein